MYFLKWVSIWRADVGGWTPSTQQRWFIFEAGVKAEDGVILYLLSQHQPVSKLACVNKYDVMNALVNRTAGKSFRPGLQNPHHDRQVIFFSLSLFTSRHTTVGASVTKKVNSSWHRQMLGDMFFSCWLATFKIIFHNLIHKLGKKWF